MLLIADSGSTKTDWRLIDAQQNISQYSTMGFNPYYITTDKIIEELKKSIALELEADAVNEIHFYGAGCSTEENKNSIKVALSTIFINAEVFVEHDLLAAARASLGTNAGIATILGTGSNSCLYDGKQIIENVPSLGYLLADEGSGTEIGKLLLTDYLYGKLPDELTRNLENRLDLTFEKAMNRIYKEPMPNKFMASLSKFVFQNIKNPYCIELVKKAFNHFFDAHISKYTDYQKYPIACVGSVGYYYSNILKSVAEERGMQVYKTMEAPIAGLTLYHMGEL